MEHHGRTITEHHGLFWIAEDAGYVSLDAARKAIDREAQQATEARFEAQLCQAIDDARRGVSTVFYG